MTSDFEVSEPILNSPFEEPREHWFLQEGQIPQRRPGRRPAAYFYRDPNAALNLDEHAARGILEELPLVNLLRERLATWRALALRGEGGVTRLTAELLNYWRREGREQRLFFAQLEAAETIIFLTEARQDLLQGIHVPPDQPPTLETGRSAFVRYALKMATGSGKTTVMGMLTAWSILNKVNNRADSRFSDVALVVCPNVTIRSRLAELNPELGEASLYRTRDLVPSHLMPDLTKGRVFVTNWHIFEPKSPSAGGESGRVLRTGVQKPKTVEIRIGPKNTTSHGWRYLTQGDFDRQVNAGLFDIIPNSEERDAQGNLKKVKVRSFDYQESDRALVRRVLGREIGNKQNILVFNDEAHHAYRIQRDEKEETTYSEDFLAELMGGEDSADEFVKEATVWVEGLDKIHRERNINFCVDLSATPYYLGRMGKQTNRIFPWTVSDFSLTDAIESGLVKIPQLAVRDTTGAEVPGYFNIWRWIMKNLTEAQRGVNPKPESVLEWAHTPIVMLAGLWEQLRLEWQENRDDPRPPVFILVCKNTKIAKVFYEWLGEDRPPVGVSSVGVEGFRNRDGQIYTIRVDSKVVAETDSDNAKDDDARWMRFTLDTVGRVEWPRDRQGNPLYPEGFEALAKKLNRPLHPPGRDIRCIVSVGMLTEGWDCNTVTHIVGLRPFMSQLLCEQVVGRGLRRASYDVNADGRLNEEVAKIFGVPFEIIPFKASTGAKPPREKRYHVGAVSQKAQYEIQYPRVQGYRSAIRNRVTVAWDTLPSLWLDPLNIPPEVQMKASLPTNSGRPSLFGPGRLEHVDLNPYRSRRRLQELTFELAKDLTRQLIAEGSIQVPTHVLFPQLLRIVERYMHEKVQVIPPYKLVDVFLSPYYGWVIENISQSIRPDGTAGETAELPNYEKNRGPGSTAEVNFWTSRDVREVVKSHLNYVVADTKQWEQSAAYILDTHPGVRAFAKNAGLGFAIPYFHGGQMHDYLPDFIIALQDAPYHYLILETKGFDENAAVKANAAQRWVNAVNTDGSYGVWEYQIAYSVAEARQKVDEYCDELGLFIQMKIKVKGEYERFSLTRQLFLISNLALILGVEENEFQVIEVLPGSIIIRTRNRSRLGSLLAWLSITNPKLISWLEIDEIQINSENIIEPSYRAQVEQNERTIYQANHPTGIFANHKQEELEQLVNESQLKNEHLRELQQKLDSFVLPLADALLACSTMQSIEGRNQVVLTLPNEIQHNLQRSNIPKFDTTNISRVCLSYASGPRKLQKALEYLEGDSVAMQAVRSIIGNMETILTHYTA